MTVRGVARIAAGVLASVAVGLALLAAETGRAAARAVTHVGRTEPDVDTLLAGWGRD